MNFWLTAIQQFGPLLAGAMFLYRYAKRLEREMKILNLQLQQLAEAAARHITKTTSPQELQAAATNASTVIVEELEPEPVELPVATARFVK